MINYEQAKNFQQRRKINLVYVLGGKCCVCGYNKCLHALDFHHINPEDKEFTLSSKHNISTAAVLEELKKCALLCANCHREFHAGELDVDLQSTYDESKAQEVLELIETSKKKQIYFCKTCGKPISKGATYCIECGEKSKRVVERPSRDELKRLVYSTSFTTLAMQFGVSDKAIVKWCIAYGLPHKKADIKKYTLEEWLNL